MHALRPVVEGGGAGDDEVEAGEAAGGDFVDELAERVEGFVAGVGAGALQGFEFVEDDEEPRWPQSRSRVRRPWRAARAPEWSRSR